MNKQLLLLSVIGLAGLVTPAQAVIVSYNTSSTTLACVSANCTLSGDSKTVYLNEGTANEVAIKYTPIAAGVVDAPRPPAFTNANFGAFDVDTTRATTSGDIEATVNLTISQLLPSVGSGTAVGSLTGTFKINASTGEVTFTPANSIVTIGEVTYDIFDLTWLVPPTTNGGVATLQGRISAVPEPGFYALSAAGLLGLLAFVRRRATNV